MLGGGAVTTMCNTPPLFKGNISVADCMSLSSLLKSKTIKINNDVERRWCMKNSAIFDEDASITAESSHVIHDTRHT